MKNIKKLVKKKSLLFSIDAIIAASLIMVVLLLISSYYINKQPTTNLHFFASDLLNVLNEVKINEVQNNSVVDDFIDKGYITKLNNSILDQIGELWSEGNLGQAENLTKEFSDDFFDSGFSFEVSFDHDPIHTLNVSPIDNMISSQKMISGIMKNRTKEGFAARSSATRINKNITQIFPFTIGGSAYDPGNTVEITKEFYLDITDEDDITNATFFLSFHYGTSNLNSNEIDVNNGECTGKLGNEIQIVDTLDKNNTHMIFAKKDLMGCLEEGWNSIKITLHVQSSGHTHLHPGTRVQVSYQKQELQNVSQLITKKLYFDNFRAKSNGNKKSGAWAIMPLFKPEFYDMKNATLYINGREILNEPNKDNIQIYLNDLTLELTDPDCNPNQNCDFSKKYDILNNLTLGTNVISVYLNTYNETFWGKDDTIIYSNPGTDPNNSSYIEYTYEITESKLQFGKIDVPVSFKFNTPRSSDVIYTKYLNNTNIYEASVELVQLDSDSVTLKVNNQNLFTTPRPLATPNSLFIDPEKLVVGNNQINVKDACPDCYILNETLFYHTILVPSLVGYGATFQTKQEAIDDARARLESVLGEYVEALEINDDVVVLSNVPSMWGPAIVRVNVWR